MAAFTTTASGNASAGATWVGGVAPSVLGGDTITINHDLTIDVDYIIGTSPSDQTTMVITMASGKKLTIAAGKMLTLRGNATSPNGTGAALILNAGATLKFDAHLAGTPATTYRFLLGTSFSTAMSFTCNGTSGSRCTVTSDAGGGAGYMTGTNSEAVASCSYTDFIRIGDTTNSAFKWQPVAIDNCVFDTCGLVNMSGLTSYSYTNNTWKNTNAATNGGTGLVNPVNISAATTGAASGKIVSGCVFDKPPKISGNAARYDDCIFYAGFDPTGPSGAGNWDRMLRCIIRVQGGGQNGIGNMTNCVIVADNVPAAVATGTATGGTSTTLTDSGASFDPNWRDDGTAGHAYFVQTTGGTGSGQMRQIRSNTPTQLTIGWPWDVTPDATTTYAIHLGISNPHFITTAAVYDGNILQNFGTSEDGDCFYESSGSVVFTTTRNIVLPNSGKGQSCTLQTIGSNTNVTMEHNTVYVGGQSALHYGDGAAGTAGGILSVKSNAVWFGFTAPASGGPGAYIVVDFQHPATPNSGTADVVTGANADYNGKFNLTTNGQTGTNGYAIRTTAAPGAHDVVGDPGFVDPWRNCESWAATLGATGTITQRQAAFWQYVRARNEPADPNYLAGATATALLAYIQAGFVPTNAAYRGTAHDGTDIGALPAAPSGGPFPFFTDNGLTGGMAQLGL